MIGGLNLCSTFSAPMTDNTLSIECANIHERSQYPVRVYNTKDGYTHLRHSGVLNKDECDYYLYLILHSMKDTGIKEGMSFDNGCFEIILHRKSKQIWHICCHRKDHTHEDTTESESTC